MGNVILEAKGIEGISATAFAVAAIRARETEKADGLLKDEFAKYFSEDILAKIPKEYTNLFYDRLIKIVVYRSLVSDTIIEDRINKNVRQIVNLGCGFDSKVYRLNLPPELKFYEIDVPAVLNYKSEVMHKINAKPKCQHYQIAMDLTNKDEWATQLLQNGFDKNLPTIFVLEGLVIYLNDDELRILFSLISNLSAKNSVVIGDTTGGNIANETSKIPFKIEDIGIKFNANPPVNALLREMGFDAKANLYSEYSSNKYVTVITEDISKLNFYFFEGVKR